ncbi:MAG: hypothetical protein Q4B43_10160 [Bacteroidota bacterium]|nr:hypothetical protein [Bacteroidota bacterium]
MSSRKKRTKLTLSEVETQMEVLTKEEMEILKGRGDGSYGSPYTTDEYYALLDSNSFYGGYVVGWGYVNALEGVEVTGSSFGSHTPPNSDFNDRVWTEYEAWKNQMMYGSSNYYGSGGLYDSYYYGSDYNSYDEIPSYSGGGGGESYHNNPTRDGIDISNSKHFSFKTQSNVAFDRQLKDILSSNKTIKGILSYFDKGIVHMTFSVKDLEGSRLAQTNYVSSESYHIEFNSKRIDQNGWNSNYKGKDNIGYDFSKARTTEECLVITLAHEAIHAKHYATYEDTMRKASNRPDIAANILLDRGYSQEFVEIYFKKDSEGEWYHNSDGRNDRAHEYMRKHDHSVIDKALEEYRRDRGL